MDRWKFDYVIVGAGFSGLVLAERLCAAAGKTCLIVERRDHIGGNAYDEYSEAGVLIHKYGPHYFRTNSARVREYLSQFTEWTPVEYKVKSWANGRLWSFPINLTTFEQFIGRSSSPEEFKSWLEENRVNIESPANSEEVIVGQVGWELYRLFFENYTKKQWKCSPKELDASVCGRIPIRTDRNDNYLVESFQALPSPSYSAMFKKILRACSDRAKVLLNTDYREVLPHLDYSHMIYTGPVDEYFNCVHGKLPYRSLRFESESYGQDDLESLNPNSNHPGFYQAGMQINYPNDHDYTRIVELKHLTQQATGNTTIIKEYPADYCDGREPYYPIPAPASRDLYAKYRKLMDLEANVSFVGRLARYRYYNMDQCVAAALKTFDKLSIATK